MSSIHETPVTLSDTNRLKPSKERLFLATHIDLFVCFVLVRNCFRPVWVLKKKKKKKKKKKIILQPCHYILTGSLDLTKIKRVPIKNFRHDNFFFL